MQQPSTQQVQLSAIERVAIEDSRTDSYLRTAFLTVIVLVGGLGGWAAMTEISGAVVATGKVAVEANSKAVQHLDGGIIREIAIKEGETVDEGQVLLRLDAGQADDSIRGLESQQRASKAQLELLKAELDDLEKLAVKRLVPRSQLAKTRRDYAELEGELGRLTAELQRMGTSRQRLEVRAPIAGRITRSVYVPGAFLSATNDKASEDNERRALVIESPTGTEIAVLQIAGLISRRIVTFAGEGDTVGVGQRFGLIRFGSRVDVYLPPGQSSLAAVGQRTIFTSFVVSFCP